FSPQTPRVHVELTPGFPAVPGQKVSIHVVAASLADITKLQLSVDGNFVALDEEGKATVIAGAPGRMDIEATATDADFFVGQAAAVLKVRDPNNTSPLAVALDSQLDGAKLSSQTSIVGTVSGTNLDSWELDRAPLGLDTFVRVAS